MLTEITAILKRLSESDEDVKDKACDFLDSNGLCDDIKCEHCPIRSNGELKDTVCRLTNVKVG